MYRQHEQRLLAYALRRAPIETAKDAVAEAFLVAWRRLDELPDDPLPWLISAARRTLANQRRSAARQARLAARMAEAPPGEASTGSDDDPIVRAALRRLRAEDREALTLIAWDGLTPTEAARSLGCSATAFRVRLHRARHRFEQLLGEEDACAGTAEWPARVGVEEVS
jgi:RNA polymerase sigma factor (sigma-70 family)